VDIVVDLAAPCPPSTMFAWVDDLTRYPQWLTIVSDVVPDDDGGWEVELRAKLGPFSRSKRLRMVRSAQEHPTLVVFDRQELDGRTHADWQLRGVVAETNAGCRLVFTLHYDGGLWGGPVERLLSEEIVRAKARLLKLVSSAEAV
jgi:ribosome-associated toxin RatA of RatAB toxin-antitoxin module